MAELEKLPLVPLKGMIVFPNMMINLDIVNPRVVAAVEEAMAGNHRAFVVAQKDATIENPERRDIYNIGTIVEIRQIFRLPGGIVRVLIECLQRATIKGYEHIEGYVEVDVLPHTDTERQTSEMEALTRAVAHKFEEWVKKSQRIPPETFVAISVLDNASRLTDIISSHLNLTLDVKQDLLATYGLKRRLEKIYGILLRELEILTIEQNIGNKLQEQVEKVQKDFYLREQIKVIKKELGDDEDKEEQISDYKQKIEKGKFPEEVKKTLEKELHHLNMMPPMSPESAMVRVYMDWIIELPWNEETKDEEDIKAAENILEEDHYGLEKVKERILEFLAVHKLTKDKESPTILCLVGPPGVGKTSLASSVARALGRKFVRASLGGVRDEAEIRGHRRTYIGSLPGRIIEGIKRAGSKNPVFLLDEIDKLSTSYQGDPSAALLEVLDPAQNVAFRDHYLELAFDLSKVFWIVTANNLANIPRPLRDRMEIITLSSYTEIEKLEIGKRYLFPRQREKNGLLAKNINLGAGVIEKIIAEYTREAGVRELERVLGSLCRKVARRIVEGEVKTVRVTKNNLETFLDKPKYPSKKAEKKPQIGVATGMAWTEVGGDILPTEVSVLKGKGELILTGQLGDVMQESARAGLSYIRSRSDDFKLAKNFYEKYDLHIHLPEGAIPKDGPSAGITMATAMISALTKRKVRSDLAMTGEITLRGNVLPIGGLKEKVIAAYREGMKTIVLPKENERDIEDIPQIVRDKLEFIPVEHMDEVLKVALL